MHLRLLTASVLLLGCATEVRTDAPSIEQQETEGGGPVSSTGNTTSNATSSGLPEDGSSSATDSTGDEPEIRLDLGAFPDAGEPQTELLEVVYAHSSNELFRVDPQTGSPSLVGAFEGCNGVVVDLAVDRSGGLLASAGGGVFSVDPASAACTQVSEVRMGNNLAFVPPGVLHPTRELLVSYQGSQYIAYDLVTEEVTELGLLLGESGLGMQLSGDLVSVKDGPTYATVTGGAADHLIRVDPADGTLIADLGPIGTIRDVFGLGFWGGEVYAFAADGTLAIVTELPSGLVETSVIEVDGPSYWGAGSSTFAPLTPEG